MYVCAPGHSSSRYTATVGSLESWIHCIRDKLWDGADEQQEREQLSAREHTLGRERERVVAGHVGVELLCGRRARDSAQVASCGVPKAGEEADRATVAREVDRWVRA